MSQPQSRRITRASNAEKHPGLIDIIPGSKLKKMSRTKAEKEADNKEKREESEDKAARRLAALLTAAEMERNQIALQEAEMANAARPGGTPGASKAMGNIGDDSDDVFETLIVSRGRGAGSRGGRGGRGNHAARGGRLVGGRGRGGKSPGDGVADKAVEPQIGVDSDVEMGDDPFADAKVGRAASGQQRLVSFISL